MCPSVKLLEHDPEAERKLVSAALFPQSDAGWNEQTGDVAAVLETLHDDRTNRRRSVPRTKFSSTVAVNSTAIENPSATNSSGFPPGPGRHICCKT